MTPKLVVRQITNNLYDVHYGKEGFDPKETVRMKWNGSSWESKPTYKYPVNPFEVAYGNIVALEDMLPMIKDALNVTRNKRSSSK